MAKNDVTRDMLNKIRHIQENVVNKKTLLKEESDKKSDAIAITDEPKFGQNVLTNQIQQFRSLVESGAQFSKVNTEKVSDCPLIYMPSNGNLIFSGVIPCLNNIGMKISKLRYYLYRFSCVFKGNNATNRDIPPKRDKLLCHFR